MSFGLAGAPGEFTRLMKKVLGGLRDIVLKNYLDDWVIDADCWNDILTKLRLVLENLRIAKLTLKPSKSLFDAKSIGFLGLVIDGGMVHSGMG